MVEYIQEFEVKPEFGGQFELIFGRGGAWSRLFSRATGYRGTTLLRNLQQPERYLLVDLWDSTALREAALKASIKEYNALNEQLQKLIKVSKEPAWYTVRSAATVHALPKSRRS